VKPGFVTLRPPCDRVGRTMTVRPLHP
jgi:hypothetical protein